MTHPLDNFKNFEFIDPGKLLDGELRLVLEKCIPANLEKGGVPAYVFNVCLGESDLKVGYLNFRVATMPILESRGHLGYGINSAYQGNHYAERSVRLILPLARLHGLSELLITCNPDNLASRRTCLRLGAELVEIVEIHPDSAMYIFADGDKTRCIYRLEL